MIEVVIETETVEEAGTRHLVPNEVTEMHPVSACRTLDGTPLLGMAAVRMALVGAGREIERGTHLPQEL
jgi:hypothetical protein